VQIPLPNSNPLDAAERGDPVILAL
jgi:hypothetical protein